MRVSIWIISCVVLALGAYNAAAVARALSEGDEAASRSTPFETAPDGSGDHVLVVGDSTAVGTGAASPEESVAGRLAADFPCAAVENLGRNGVLTSAVPDQLQNASMRHYDLILIQVGGNDALRFSGRNGLAEAISTTLSMAASMSDRVLLISVGDLGQAPALPWPLTSIYSWRSRIVREVFANAAQEQQIPYLDWTTVVKEESPFQRNPGKYYAEDGLHPSGAGYGVWYARLRDAHPLEQWLCVGQSAQAQ